MLVRLGDGEEGWLRPVRRAPATPSARRQPRTASPHAARAGYAPGLDGVRALAVAAVLLYHGGVAWLPGGFLGVDVFFVLSGYLITSLLLLEHRDAGRVDLVRFWARRARRLLPAAVLVVIVCLVAGSVFLRTDLHALRSDALASLLYVNNWHQILVSHSYFASFDRPSLLQHFWSLSVEEQFYLVWPLVLAGGLAIGRRGYVVGAAVVVAGVSAALMALLYRTGVDPSRVYYGTDTRAAPLMIGAVLAFAWPLGGWSRRPSAGALALLDGAGVAALGALIFVMHGWRADDPFLYRGGFVLVGLAAMVFIAVAAHPITYVGLLLGTRPLRWVGQRSYGIYLWHWPVMAVTRPGVDLHLSSAIVIAMQVVITLTLASLSYRFVETPIRRGEAQRKLRTWWDRRRPRQRLVTASATIAATSAVIVSIILMPSIGPSSAGLLPALARAATGTRSHSGQIVTSGAYITHQASTSALEGGPPHGLLAVGSSVMLAAKDALERRVHARVDAVAGRSSAAIVDRLEAYRRARELPSTVVVQIGDDGSIPSAVSVRLRAVLGGVANVVLVDVREPAVTWEGEVNAALERIVAHWPRAIVADWHAASASGNLVSHAGYPNRAGQVVYAAVIARALTALAARKTVHGIQATVISDSVGATILYAPPAMQALTAGLPLRLELMVCRRLIATSCTYDGVTPPPALQTIESLGRALGPVLVVDVGYNDDSEGYGSGIDQIMRAALAQGAHTVIWLTLRENGYYASTYHATNASIRQAARRRPQLEIADWNRYSAGKPWFADDVHPNASGAVALAQFVRAHIINAAAGG